MITDSAIPPLRRINAHTQTLLISNVGGAVLSVLLSAVIGRTLGETGLGTYALALAWVFPLNLVVDFGLGTLLTRDVAATPTLAANYLHLIALQRLVMGGALLLLLIAATPLISPDLLLQRAITISAPMLIILPFFGMFSALLRAAGDMQAIAILNIGMLIAQLVITALVLAFGGDVIVALAINVITSAGQLAAAWAFSRRIRIFTPPATTRPIRLHFLLRSALPFAGAGILAAVGSRLTLILLEALTTTADVGYFNAASRFTEAAKLVPNAFFGALLPALAALVNDLPALRRLFQGSQRRLLLYAVAAAVGIAGGAPVWIAVIYGDRFLPAVPTLIVLSIGLIPTVLRAGRTLYWYACRREATVNRITAALLLVQIIVSLALILPFGTVGAALALLVVDSIALLCLMRSPLRSLRDSR